MADPVRGLGIAIDRLPRQVPEIGLSDRQLDNKYKTGFYERTQRIVREHLSWQRELQEIQELLQVLSNDLFPVVLLLF